MDLLHEYERWRRNRADGWGLTWYLSAQIAERFYASHGVAPVMILHDGLGYYGMAIERLVCARNKRRKMLGRLTMSGNVENWRTGSPGDHGLKLVERAAAGEPVQPMIAEAIAHLDLPALPRVSHLPCRHKRWGASAVLVFRLAAALALRHDARVGICNTPDAVRRAAGPLDPHRDGHEHLGWTYLSVGEQKVILANDGRVLLPHRGESLWVRYMRGESEDALLVWLEEQLGLHREPAAPASGRFPGETEGEPGWHQAIRSCRRCHEQCPQAIYSGPEGDAYPLFHERGNLDADVLFVAEAPNLDDTFDPDKGELTVDPGTDPSGRFAFELLTEVLGLEPDEVLFTNSVLCLPAGRGGKYPVKAAMRKRCAVNLRRLIEEVKPRIVVTLGAKALEAVNGIEHHPFRSMGAGVAQSYPWCGRVLFPLFHTSALGRRNRSAPDQRADWQALKQLLDTL